MTSESNLEKEYAAQLGSDLKFNHNVCEKKLIKHHFIKKIINFLRKNIVAATIGLAVIFIYVLFFVANGLNDAACPGVYLSQSGDLSDEDIINLRKCMPNQIFDLAQQRRKQSPQQALVLFEYAANEKFAAAARLIGEMADPQYWSAESSPFSAPNPMIAEREYRRAASLNDAVARERLKALAR